MSTSRRIAALVVAVGLACAVGCGSSSPPPAPEPPAPKPQPLPVGDGSLIRRSNEPAPPPESPPPPKPGEIVLPKDGGAWPWNLAAAPAPAASRPVAISGYLYAESTTAGIVVSPSARLAVVLIAERVKDEEKMTRIVWCDLAAGAIRSEWKVKGNYAPLDMHPDGHRVLAVRPPGEGRTGSAARRGSRTTRWTSWRTATC